MDGEEEDFLQEGSWVTKVLFLIFKDFLSMMDPGYERWSS